MLQKFHLGRSAELPAQSTVVQLLPNFGSMAWLHSLKAKRFSMSAFYTVQNKLHHFPLLTLYRIS